MRDIKIQVGDIVRFRTGHNTQISVFVEDIDRERTSPTAWWITGPRVGQDGHVWARDWNAPAKKFGVHPSLITSISEGVINEHDGDTGLMIVWSPTDQAYAVKQGEHRYVCMTDTFAEAREAVRSYR